MDPKQPSRLAPAAALLASLAPLSCAAVPVASTAARPALAADVPGRVLVRPDELQAGLVTAFLGAPVLIALVRRSRARAL